MRLVSLTPIARHFPHAFAQLTRDIRIVGKPTFYEPDWRSCNLRRTEEEAVLKRDHWLCIERESSWPDHVALGEMADDIRTAMLGFQLWAPIGWDGLILDCWRREEDGLLSIETPHLAEQYTAPLWARNISIATLSPAYLSQLVQGTLTAVKSGFVPIVNPFRFLEIGLQTAVNHPRAGSVLWMMGLDGLLGAENKAAFSRRLQKLLGADTHVFPADSAGRQPTYTVGELAADMYEFPGLIAHGREILQKYRDPMTFEYEKTDSVEVPVAKWSRGTLIIEGIVFSLMAALQRVITEGLMKQVKSQRTWEQWLDAPP